MARYMRSRTSYATSSKNGICRMHPLPVKQVGNSIYYWKTMFLIGDNCKQMGQKQVKQCWKKKVLKNTRLKKLKRQNPNLSFNVRSSFGLHNVPRNQNPVYLYVCFAHVCGRISVFIYETCTRSVSWCIRTVSTHTNSVYPVAFVCAHVARECLCARV